MPKPPPSKKCNRCNKRYLASLGKCPKCGCPEYRIPKGVCIACMGSGIQSKHRGRCPVCGGSGKSKERKER